MSKAVFSPTATTDCGEVLGCDLLPEQYHVTKFIAPQDRVVCCGRDHVEPVVHALACTLNTVELICSVILLQVGDDLTVHLLFLLFAACFPCFHHWSVCLRIEGCLTKDCLHKM
eukprot:15349322-Ditylum_brightwellii.AAC.1